MTSRLHAPREAEIRQALKAWIGVRSPRAAAIDELAIKHGKFRVDVCAIAGDLHGFEIKSDQDTLTRLPAQAKHFSLVFHRMTLVVGPSLLGKALALLPPWWGILLVTVDEEGGTRFAELREAAPNPRPNYRWVVRLLWRGELLDCLQAAGVRGCSKLKYWEVANRMLEVFTPEELTARVALVLRARKTGEIVMPVPMPAPAPSALASRPRAGALCLPSRRPAPGASRPAPRPAGAPTLPLPPPPVVPSLNVRPGDPPREDPMGAQASEPSLQWLIMGL